MPWDTADLEVLFSEDMPGSASAVFAGGTTVGGLFRADPGQALDGLIGGTTPQFRAPTDSLPTLSRGLGLTVNGASWTVADWDELPQGVTVIALEAA